MKKKTWLWLLILVPLLFSLASCGQAAAPAPAAAKTVVIPTPTEVSVEATSNEVTLTHNPTSTLEFGGYGRPDNCPTDGSMQKLLGLEGLKPVFTGENVVWDHCKWNAQSTQAFTLTLLPLWQATVTEVDQTVVSYYGEDGLNLTVRGFTLRYLPAYDTEETEWVKDPCNLIVREYAFGMRRVPAYTTEVGNLDCPEWVAPKPGQFCPESPLQAAALIGGDWYEYWTPPDWEKGAWVFRDPTHHFHTLRHPGGPGHLDVWTADQGAVEVYASDTSLLRRLNFEEASFHCQ